MNHGNASSDMSHSLSRADRIARGLGWFSIGLGLFELCAPRKLTETLGMQGKETFVRLCGMREIGAGIGALSDNPTPAIWSRVGGDGLDLAALAMAYRGDNPQKHNVCLAMGFVLGATALDLCCAKSLTKQHKRLAGPTPDYSDRSGFKRPVEAMRGAARDFKTPDNMRADLPMPRI